MTNFTNTAARSLIGIAGALFLGFGLLTVTVAPAMTLAPLATQSA